MAYLINYWKFNEIKKKNNYKHSNVLQQIQKMGGSKIMAYLINYWKFNE